MKATIFLSMLAAMFSIFACDPGDDAVDPIVPLTGQERVDLLYLYEEEKMARDLYTIAKELYGSNQFTNISESEQRHMDHVVVLFEEYNVDYPSDNAPGVFDNAEIQAMFDELKVRMESSEMEAVQAALLVEETDIDDIRTLRDRTEKQDLIDVYDSLECGSGNHLRAYHSKLENLGGTYEPQVLTVEEFEFVLEQDHMHCG